MKTYRAVDVQTHVFLTSALVGGEVSASFPGRFTLEVSIRWEAAWTPEPTWTTWRTENSCPYRDSNPDHPIVQPVASRYIDYAIPAPIYMAVDNLKSIKVDS
jgi:hypothetical protein